MRHFLTPLILLVLFRPGFGQNGIKTNLETDRWQVGESMYICSGIDLFPDGKTVLLGETQAHPLYLYDLESRRITREIEMNGYYAGPKVTLSSSGRYVLMQQQFYMDMSPNRDRQVLYEVMALPAGTVCLKIENAHSAAFSPDEKYLLTLEGADVCWYSLDSGRQEKKEKLPYATSSIAVTRDGSEIAVSHEPSEEELEQIASVRNDKKAIKSAMKYRELISFFTFDTFRKTRTVDEVYDIIFHLQPAMDGRTLFVYARPHTKLKEQGLNEGYINTVDIKSGEALRASFMSRIPDPDFKDSPDSKYFGIVSRDSKSPQLHVYETATGAMVTIFDITHSMGVSIANHETGDGRAYFVWSGNDEITLVYGNHLQKWRIE